IKSLPADLHVPEITIFDLTSNELESIDSFLGMVGVRDLFLGSNRISRVDGSIGLCTRLAKLNLTCNQLVELPDEVGDLAACQEMDLRGNILRALPAGIVRAGGLRKLLACNNRIAELPEDIGSMSKLVTLNLSRNNLAAVPKSFAAMSSLKELQLSFNKLVAVPAELGSLAALSSLHLGWNAIGELNSVLATSQRLMLLHMNGNALAAFPPELCELRGLKELYLGFTRVEVVPDQIGEIRGINALDVSGSLVSELPAALSQAKFLDRLDVSDGVPIPEELFEKRSLRITVVGEPVRRPGYVVAQASMRGRRYNMEDASAIVPGYCDVDGQGYFGVFDGHGGDEAALLVADLHPADLRQRLEALGPAVDNEECVVDALKRSFIDVNAMLTTDKIKKSGS
ncbi:MAG TPA: hypothetical protein VJB16_02940, partial [archaeon]|nr:hypothetical protein [archaeon]